MMPNNPLAASPTGEAAISASDPVDVQIWLMAPSWDKAALPNGPAPVVQQLFRVNPGMTLEAHEFALLDIRGGEVADVIFRVQGRTDDTATGGNLGPPSGPHILGGRTIANIRTELTTTQGIQSPHVESVLSWNRGTPWGEFPRLFPENAVLSVKAWNWNEDHHLLVPAVHDYSGDVVLIARLTGILYSALLDVPISTTGQALKKAPGRVCR